MSHFTVTVRLTKERLDRHDGDVDGALAQILAPFKEETDDERYIAFCDEEDEMRKKYAADTTERVRLPDGSLVSTYDDQFRVPGSFGTSFGKNPSHVVPDSLAVEKVPFTTLYATFEAYAKDYCGHDGPDKKTGRYGYWRNPNAKWDWFSIGGRWTGFYPLKKGAKRELGRPGAFDNKPDPGGDIVRVSDIDFDGIAAKSRERMTKFWGEWIRWLDGEKFPAFEGPRAQALDVGLLRVVREPVTTKAAGERVISWEGTVAKDDDRRHWSDVATIVDEATFFRDYAHAFDTLTTYAALDDDGWHAPGRMGWFGCSDDTPDTFHAFKKEFRSRFIDACGPDDLLVCVDCHI